MDNQTQGETNPPAWVRAVWIADEAKLGGRKGVAADHGTDGKI